MFLRPWLLAALILAPFAADAETIVGRRIFADFGSEPTTAEINAAEHAAPELYAKAKAAGRPIFAKVARSDATTLISLESVAVCERAKGCPLLVFRQITQKPILVTSSFQNLILDYRDKATFLIIRVWDVTTECRVSNVAKAICHDIPTRR
ncbi:MAG: hypothetical protein Q7R40_06600 [Phaeospirillum sp.]|nr:hypothetical protein [Phaeospirillum sp.]